MNCDLFSGVGGGEGGGGTGGETVSQDGTDRSSLNEISDLDSLFDQSGGSGGGANQEQIRIKMRANIVNEILQTEKSYLKSLKLMTDVSF